MFILVNLASSLMSLNARVLRQIYSINAKLYSYLLNNLKQIFFFFQESHSTHADTNFWKSLWGNYIWLSHGSEHGSAGVAIFKSKFSNSVLHYDCDTLGHYICTVVRHDNNNFIVVNIYGCNNKSENERLLDALGDRISFWLSRYPGSILLIGGDLNSTLDNKLDRWPPGRETSYNANVNIFMDIFNIVDAWREKFPNDKWFTWSNKTGSRQSRIDFWLVSNCVNKDNITVNIHVTRLTDHRVIHISIQIINPDNILNKCTYWKLNNSLLKHEVVVT